MDFLVDMDCCLADKDYPDYKGCFLDYMNYPDYKGCFLDYMDFLIE